MADADEGPILDTSGRVTPPNANPLPSGVSDTPLHGGLSSFMPFSSQEGIVQPRFELGARELDGKWIRAPVKEFLDKYLPANPNLPALPPVDYEAFKKVHALEKDNNGLAKERNERTYYEPLTKILQRFVREGWEVANTSSHSDKTAQSVVQQGLSPDLTIYSNRPSLAQDPKSRTRAADMETFVEIKARTVYKGFGANYAQLEDPAQEARDTRGQLVTYLSAMQANQYRTHGFGVLIVKNLCRLLRHTRSGIEVTNAFNIDDTDFLPTFLWRLSHAAEDVRGIDTTFERVNKIDVPRNVKEILQPKADMPIWKVRVGEKDFYVGSPFTSRHLCPVGRGTRCFYAVQEGETTVRVLKDVWRVEGYHAEGDVYEKLHAKDVRNIAGIMASGDVLGGEGAHQCGTYPDSWEVPATLRKHVHYRIVLDVVGAPLEHFESVWEMVSVVYDAFIAHSDAHTLAGVDHRDLSVGNIIAVRIDGKVKGLLIDWELARYSSDTQARAYDRTGTLQFRSARLSGPIPPKTSRTVADDIESFVLILLWLSLLYVENSLYPASRGNFMSYFDSTTSKSHIYLLGAETFSLLDPYLEELLNGLMAVYATRYKPLGLRPSQEKKDKLEQSRKMLETHEWMRGQLEGALRNDGWRDAERIPARRQEYTSTVPAVAGTKRKSSLVAYGARNAKKLREDDGEVLIDSVIEEED